MADYKRIALCLHNLAKTDQQWLMNQLPSEHKFEVECMLQDIQQQGFPVVGSHVVLQLLAESASSETTDQKQQAITLINRVSLSTIQEALGKESDFIVAIILDCYPWVWKEAYLKSLGRSQQHEITSQHKLINTLSLCVKEATLYGFLEQMKIAIPSAVPKFEAIPETVNSPSRVSKEI